MAAAARPWPAQTKKGTDCHLCQAEGQGVFCHHHAEGTGGQAPGFNFQWLGQAFQWPGFHLNALWLWRALYAILFAFLVYTLALPAIALGVFKLKANLCRCSSVIPKAEAMKTAYHEAGHALVGLKTDSLLPISEATIARFEGMWEKTSMWGFPHMHHVFMSKKHVLANVDVYMGRRVAEELIYGSTQPGSTGDMDGARSLARIVATRWGTSGHGRLIGLFTQKRSQMHMQIDHEVNAILDQAYNRTTQLLARHKHDIYVLGNAILE